MKVIDIIPDKNKLAEINQLSRVKRRELIREHLCNSCNEWATKLIEYQVGDTNQKATRIERYCQTHFELLIKK